MPNDLTPEKERNSTTHCTFLLSLGIEHNGRVRAGTFVSLVVQPWHVSCFFGTAEGGTNVVLDCGDYCCPDHPGHRFWSRQGPLDRS